MVKRRERNKSLHGIKRRLDKISKVAEDICDPDDENCLECEKFMTCFNGMRLSIRDLADTSYYILNQIKELDDALADLIVHAGDRKTFIKRKKKEEVEKEKGDYFV